MDIDARIERARRKEEVYAMCEGVTIRDGHEAEGAVAGLWRVLKSLEWSATTYHFGTEGPLSACPNCLQSSERRHTDNCGLDAELRRFDVEDDTEARADTGGAAEGR